MSKFSGLWRVSPEIGFVSDFSPFLLGTIFHCDNSTSIARCRKITLHGIVNIMTGADVSTFLS